MSPREEILADGVRLILGDCRDVLPTLGKLDAIVTDPPYGIGEARGKNKSRGWLAVPRDYGMSSWDDKTQDDALALALAAAKWAVVFGGNYYHLPPTSCWLVWDKLNGETDFADCELAWTNLPKAVRRIRYLWNGCMRKERDIERVHPTQKPVGVMVWCLEQLPAEVRRVCDPFAGSGTTGVAAVRRGLEFVGIERDARYFDVACGRIADELKAPRFFAEPIATTTQEALTL